MKSVKVPFPTIDLGLLPVALVSNILGCKLTPGIVRFSSANQDHAFGRHQEFLSCLPHVVATVLYPEYVGQSPHHPWNSRWSVLSGEPKSTHVLVAVTLETVDDHYMVQSIYPIGYGIVRRRLRKGHLFQVE